MTDSRRYLRRLPQLGFRQLGFPQLGFLVLAGALAAGVGCSGSPGGLGDLDDLSVDTKTVDEEIMRILRALFPDLSDEELVEIKVDLDLEAILALEAELKEVREAAEKMRAELFMTAEERVERRTKELADHHQGYPESLEPVGRVCLFDEATNTANVHLSGVFSGETAISLESSQVSVLVDGVDQDVTLECLAGGPSVDIVFLIDITGSMSDVIRSVRNSVLQFVDALEASGVNGTISVVSFQDTVGVNTTFQESAPPGDLERSPFLTPVAIDAPDQVDEARAFINRLEANQGADAPENLSGAIDFARNNVIGYTSTGAPNVIGDGVEDPTGTEAFPRLESDRQIFVALTDSTYHGDDRDSSNSSLEAPFVPRDSADILATLHRSETVVHVSDPSWVDGSIQPVTRSSVDADYWAIHTGGVGEDLVLGYSLVDLELVVTAAETGLLEIALDGIISSTCTARFEADLSASAEIELKLDVDGEVFTDVLPVVSYSSN